MSKQAAWVRCKHCMFVTRESIIVQFKEGDVDHWQYCPGCGEEWDGLDIGTTAP